MKASEFCDSAKSAISDFKENYGDNRKIFMMNEEFNEFAGVGSFEIPLPDGDRVTYSGGFGSDSDFKSAMKKIKSGSSPKSVGFTERNID